MTPIEFTENWFNEIWNKGNSDYVREHLCPDCIIHGLPPEANGVEGFIQFQQVMLNTINNLHIDIVNATENNSQVTGIARVTGHYFDNEAPVDFCFGFYARIEKDMIIEARNAVDFLTFLTQAGKLNADLLPQAFKM